MAPQILKASPAFGPLELELRAFLRLRSSDAVPPRARGCARHIVRSDWVSYDALGLELDE
jgi:hypothetical protein